MRAPSSQDNGEATLPPAVEEPTISASKPRTALEEFDGTNDLNLSTTASTSSLSASVVGEPECRRAEVEHTEADYVMQRSVESLTQVACDEAKQVHVERMNLQSVNISVSVPA